MISYNLLKLNVKIIWSPLTAVYNPWKPGTKIAKNVYQNITRALAGSRQFTSSLKVNEIFVRGQSGKHTGCQGFWL